MKAITVRQPWAWAIVNMGKDIENRTWETKYRGPLLIHAAKTLSISEYQDFVEACKVRKLGTPPDYKDLKKLCGGVIGIVDLVDVVHKSKSKWFRGPIGFKLANPRPLPFYSSKGQLNIFNLEMPLLRGFEVIAAE